MQSHRPLWKRLAPDIAGFVCLSLAALAIGIVINHFRAKPLPLVYHTKTERLELAVATLSKTADTNKALATNAVVQAGITQIDIDELKHRSETKSGFILDARASLFYQMGHVPGALSLPRSDFEAAYANLKARLASDKSMPIAVYCSGSDCEDSQMVADALAKLGFEYVAVFKGGWEEWTGAHLPEEKSP